MSLWWKLKLIMIFDIVLNEANIFEQHMLFTLHIMQSEIFRFEHSQYLYVVYYVLFSVSVC